MPKLETILDDSGKYLDIINIDQAVGAKGVNHPEDVKIIKALFYFIPRAYKKGKTVSVMNSLGYDSSWNIPSNKIPSPHDGTMWGIVELTKSFQKFAHKMLSNYGYRVNISGTIKPSNGYALVGKNYSTIAALNVFAALGARHYKNGYIEEIMTAFHGEFEYLGYEEEELEGDQ